MATRPPTPVERMTAYIKARIDRGTLETGNKLPPTNALMSQFNLSDNAVYRGIALLKAEGYLVSLQGKGVFVADRRKLITGPQRIRGITQPGETIHHKLSERIHAPAWVAEHLGEGECVNRVRTIERDDHTVVESSQSWVHTDIAAVVPEIDEPAPCDPTWQAVYEDRSGNVVEVASKTAEARITTSEDRAKLGLADDFAVLVVRSIYVSEERVIGVGEAVYPPGRPLSIS